MIENKEMYDRLDAMSEEEMAEILDPICYAVQGKVTIYGGVEVLANRVFALAVLDLYEKWQKEKYEVD
jgi:hypothetical protein